MKFRYALALLPILLGSCGDKNESSGNSGNGKPVIAAVNYPLAYFAERLAGDFATILFEAPADEDPSFWKPSDEQIARIQKADLILLNGASYAKWTTTTTLPFETSVDTSASFADNLIEVDDAVTHNHGKDGEAHSHGGIAFTTWMDLEQAAAQATAAAEAIAADFPAHKDSVTQHLAALVDDLQQLDAAMTAATAKLKGAPVLASHPVYQYWARAYGLDVHALHWEPEMDLDAAARADLKTMQDAHLGATYFLWEGEPLAGHIETLKAAGLTSIVVSPCGNKPASGDFLSVMKDNVAAIEAAVP